MSSEASISTILKNSIDIVGCLSNIAILSLNLWFLHSLWIGLVCFALYAVFICRAISRELTFFNKYLVLPFSFLFLNMLFAMMSAVVIGLSIPLSNELLVVFLLVPMLFFLKQKPQKEELQKKVISKSYSLNPILLLVFSLSLIGMLFTILCARTGNTIPYFQINLNFSYYIFNFVAIVSAVITVLSSCSLRSKLIIVSAYSIVSHLFRYVIYAVIWGSDAWNNLQYAWWINDGGVLKSQPNLYYYLARSDNAYLSFCGINVSISRITGIDLFSLYPYIGLLLALFVPLILYQIVKSLVNNETYALLVALMSSFLWDTFYWLSFSLANGLGILGMLLSLLFWVLYLKKEKMPIFLPLLMTVSGILAYPLTGIFVASIAVFSISVKRIGIRKSVAIIGLLSCLALPLYDVYTQLTYFIVSGVHIPGPNFLPVDALFNKLIFLSQRSFDLYGFNLSNLFDIPYLIIYVLAGIGIILGRRQVKREIYFLLLTVMVSAFFSEAYALWAQARTYQRIGATILPWLCLIFSSMSFKWVYTNITEIIPTLRISLNSLSSLKRNYSVQPQKIFAISLCIILGAASTSNFIFSPTTNSYNASVDQVNAVKYIISQDPSKDSLILTDSYTIKLLSPFSHGRWYNYPYGDRLSLDALSLTLPMYYQILVDPSNVQFAIQEGKTSVMTALAKLNVTCDMNKFYLVYDADMVKYQYLRAGANITETLSPIIGAPKVFGNVFVYSGYILENATYGYITQVDDNTMVYSMAFTDLKSLLSEFTVEGQIIYDDTHWNGLLAFKPNSSLTMKIDAEHKIINASLSCSIYQYEEYDNNSIQVSVDGINWLTTWKANTTGTYIDINDLKLPQILNGHSSFYLRFYSENVNNKSAYSLAIRTTWDNAPNGIKLKIFANT